jgi:hypothetical protein
MIKLLLGFTLGALMFHAAVAPTTAAATSAQGGGAVTLVPPGKTGAAGSAVLSQQGNTLTVMLRLPKGYATPAQAAIYNGSCTSSGSANVKGKALFKLMTNSGTAKTTLNNASITKLTASPHAIVVNGSPKLCGDLQNMLPPQKP